MTEHERPPRRRVDAEWVFPAVFGVISVALLLVWFDALSAPTQHPLYTSVSLAYGFLASAIIVLLSFRRSTVVRMFCILFSAFYTQRFIATYLVPGDLDYDAYRHFSRAEIESSAQYFFLVVVAMLIGVVLYEVVLKSQSGSGVARNGAKAPRRPDHISYFGVTVPFERLCALALQCLIPLYLYKFGVMALTGFGLTGTVYEPSDVLLKWSMIIPDILASFAIFGVIYFRENPKLLRLSRWGIALVLLNGLAVARKGFLLNIILHWYLVARILGWTIPKKYLYAAGGAVLFSTFVFFPAMTILRERLLLGYSNADISSMAQLSEPMRGFSSRLGGLDWMNLWHSVPAGDVPPQLNVLDEFGTLVHHLHLGDIRPQGDLMNISKVQVLLGRGWGNPYELGGHGENMGGPATWYVFLGPVGALVYVAVLIAGLMTVERSSLHAMHKFTIFGSYIVINIIGGSFILMQSEVFWFLLYATILTVFLACLGQANYVRASNRSGPAMQAE